MNPKINPLLKPVACDHVMFPDFEDLKFGASANGTILFNASLYAESMGVDFSYSKFSNSCIRDINSRLVANNAQLSEMFWSNPNGDILINQILVLIFLRYISIDTEVYFDLIIESCLRDGIAFSDTLVANLAYSKLPVETLQGIIQSRDEQK